MRTYLIFKDKVKRFQQDAEIQALIAESERGDSSYDGPAASSGYTREHGTALKSRALDVATLAGRGRRYEELDQMVIELLLGAR